MKTKTCTSCNRGKVRLFRAGTILTCVVPMLLFSVRPKQQVEFGAGGGFMDFEYTPPCGDPIRERHEMAWLFASYQVALVRDVIKLRMEAGYSPRRFWQWEQPGSEWFLRRREHLHSWALLPSIQFDTRYLGIGLGSIVVFQTNPARFDFAWPSVRLRIGPRLFNWWWGWCGQLPVELYGVIQTGLGMELHDLIMKAGLGLSLFGGTGRPGIWLLEVGWKRRGFYVTGTIAHAEGAIGMVKVGMNF